jgi:hypothetical protein
MESSGNKRLLIAVGLVLLLVIVALVWYFVYAKPLVAPSLGGTNDPIAERQFRPRFQFLNWGENAQSREISNETKDPRKEVLTQIWDKPASGHRFFNASILKEVTATTTQGTSTNVIEVKRTVRATSTILLFIDKTTGYIYRYSFETGKTSQISNTLIPGVSDAYFFNNGERVIIRYPEKEKNTVSGIIATLPNVTENGEALPLVDAQYLTQEVMSVAVNKKGDLAAYVVATTNGSSLYLISGKTVPRLVTSSPFREFTVSFGGNSLYLTSKPSAYVEGSTFLIRPSGNTQGGVFEVVTDGKTGLITNPGEIVHLNSMWGKNGLVTFLSNNGQTKTLSIQTIASKCVWGTNNFLVCAVPRLILRGKEGLPDDWFQGRTTFEDDLVTVDPLSGEHFSLYSFKNEDGIFDIESLSIDDENGVVSFVEKEEETLWLLNTNNFQQE